MTDEVQGGPPERHRWASVKSGYEQGMGVYPCTNPGCTVALGVRGEREHYRFAPLLRWRDELPPCGPGRTRAERVERYLMAHTIAPPFDDNLPRVGRMLAELDGEITLPVIMQLDARLGLPPMVGKIPYVEGVVNMLCSARSALLCRRWIDTAVTPHAYVDDDVVADMMRKHSGLVPGTTKTPEWEPWASKVKVVWEWTDAADT